MESFIVTSFLAFLTLASGSYVHEMEMVGGKFAWSLCNKTATPIAVSKLEISPDPIQLGKTMMLTAQVVVTSDVGTTSSLQADLKVMMNIEGQYFDVCNYDPSYCHLKDLCSVLKKGTLPCPFKDKWNCKCPLPKKTYTITNMPIPIKDPKISISGEFDITLDMHESGKEVGCLKVHLCVGSC